MSSLTLDRFTPWRELPSTRAIGDWVGLRVGLFASENRDVNSNPVSITASNFVKS